MANYDFFQNKACEYFPCHKCADTENFSCLFCYCPLYALPRCPGTPRMMESGGKTIRDCSNCTFPHRPENYEKIIACLSGR